MTVIETDKIYVLYTRMNRRVQWKYAAYGGRYRTIEDAVYAAKQYYGKTPFEYRIESMADDSVTTGFVNQKGKK